MPASSRHPPTRRVQFARIFSASSGTSHHLVTTTSSTVQWGGSEMHWSCCECTVLRQHVWWYGGSTEALAPHNKAGQVEKNPDQGSQFASQELAHHMRTQAQSHAHTGHQCSHTMHTSKLAHTQKHKNTGFHAVTVQKTITTAECSASLVTCCICSDHPLDVKDFDFGGWLVGLSMLLSLLSVG